VSVTYDLCYCECRVETPIRLFCVSFMSNLFFYICQILLSFERYSDSFLYPVGKGKYFFSFYLEREFNNGVYAMEVCIIVHELVL
jgi:hypothetical protein